MDRENNTHNRYTYIQIFLYTHTTGNLHTHIHTSAVSFQRTRAGPGTASGRPYTAATGIPSTTRPQGWASVSWCHTRRSPCRCADATTAAFAIAATTARQQSPVSIRTCRFAVDCFCRSTLRAFQIRFPCCGILFYSHNTRRITVF